ncbi:MAG: hypothetical protein R3E82_21595 [Pseudomonadales bacterium]
MAKYYVGLVLVFGLVLLYIFLNDPCSNRLRVDFLEKHPDYEILFSGAGADTPENSLNHVNCHIRYRTSEGIGTYEDIWVYENSGDGWKFAGIRESRRLIE